MKVLKIFGIVAAVHALAFLMIMANPGCSTKPKSTPPPPVAATDTGSGSPTISVPSGQSSSGGDAAPIASAPMSNDTQGLGFDPNAPASGPALYSPTRPGTAAASALQPAPIEQMTPATTVTVERGDSLWTIAHKNKISIADLRAANHLKAGAVLQIGQKLIVPSKAVSAGAASAAPVDLAAPRAEQAVASRTGSVKHVVKPGETLGSIARKYGVRAGDIAVANNISNPAMIRVGRELIIPGWKAPKSGQSHAKPAKSVPVSQQPVPQPDDQASAPSAAPAQSQSTAPVMPQIGGPSSDQDLDAGLKKSGQDGSVPVINVDDGSGSSSDSGSTVPAGTNSGSQQNQNSN